MSSESMVIKRKPGVAPQVLYFLIPAIVLVGFVLVFPIIFAFFLSTFKWPLVETGNRQFIFLDNYINIFKDKEFWHALYLQIGFILIAIPIELIIGFSVALLFYRSFPFATLIRSLLLLPVFVLPVLSGLTWRLMLQPEYGPLNYLISKLGFKQLTWLADPKLAYTAIIIQDIWRMWPFMFMIIYAGLTTIPKDLIEAAKLDGARFRDRVFKIIIPLLKPTIATALLLRIIDALRIFSEVFIMTEGGPGNATTLLSIYIYRQAFRYFNMGYSSAMAIILMLISLIISIIIVSKNFEVE